MAKKSSNNFSDDKKKIEDKGKDSIADPLAAKDIPPAPRAEKKPFVDTYDLPSSYNSTSITLIARDPHWMYAYWEISQSTIQDVKSAVGQEFDMGAYVLRLYDVTSIEFNGNNANHWFDIEVGPHANNWYINIWHDNVSYCADIGMRMPDGRFLKFARSNFVTTPRKNESGRGDQMWMEVKDNPSTPPFVIGETHRKDDLSGPDSIKKNSRRNINPSPFRRPRKYFLTEDDIREYYSKLSPLLRDIIAARLAKQHGAKSRISFHPKEDKPLFNRQFLRGKFYKKILGGASEELAFEGASELSSAGASEKTPEGKRQFFFEIGTELIVYGRTEPDAEVWLRDKRIPLRSDGTFTLRYALPDGKIPLDFMAHSSNKIDKKGISTAVERTKTIYSP